MVADLPYPWTEECQWIMIVEILMMTYIVGLFLLQNVICTAVGWTGTDLHEEDLHPE